MRPKFNIGDRVPMVWFLLGLLLNAGGLYLGFDNPLSFVSIIVGWFCCAFGLALLALKLIERPKAREATRLSPNFISAGSTASAPAMKSGQSD